MLDKLRNKVANLSRDPSKAVTTAVVVTLAGLATREAVEWGWRLAKGEAPPHDPSRPDVDLRTALGWTTAVGVAVGLARLATRRALHPGKFTV